MADDFTKYDAYLGTQGVIFYREQEMPPETSAQQLRPDRVDIGNNPSEMRPEFGDLFAQEDFSHGAGQIFFHRPGRDERRYWTSEGFDISEQNRLKHLQQVASAYSSTTIGGAIAVANDLPFIIDNVAATERVRVGNGAFPGTWTAENPRASGTGTLYDLTSDGDNLYVACGETTNGIRKRVPAGTYSTFNNSQAWRRCIWAKQRVIAATQTQVYEISPDGVTATLMDTLQAGWTVESIFEAGAFIYACCHNKNGALGEVRHYGLKPDLSGLELKGTTALPIGQVPLSGTGYLGQVYIGAAKRTSSSGWDPVCYQGFTDAQGFLQLVKLVEDKNSGARDLGVYAVEPLGESVLYGFSLAAASTTGAREGIAVHHLGRDALAYHLAKDTPAANPSAVTAIHSNYHDRTLFIVAGDGLYYEDLNALKPTATLISSIADFDNAGMKVWDRFAISHRPLPNPLNGAQVIADYSLRHFDDAVWNAVIVAGDNAAASEGVEKRITSANQSRVLALRLTSSANAAKTLAPEIIGFTIRSNPVPLNQEWTLQRTIRVVAHDRKDDHAEYVQQDPDAIKTTIEGLINTWVQVREPDQIWTAFVTGVQRVEPAQPLYRVATGESSRNAYVFRISMVATKG